MRRPVGGSDANPSVGRTALRQVVSMAPILLLVARIGLGQSVSGEAILGYQDYRAGDDVSRGFIETVDLGYQNHLTDEFGVSLYGRAVGNQNVLSIGDSPASDSHLIQWQPHAELTYALPRLRLFAIWGSVDTRTTTGGNEIRTVSDTFSSQLNWVPEDLPGLSLGVDRTHFRDDRSSLDQIQANYNQSLSYQLGPFGLDQFSRYSVEDIATSSFHQTSGDLGGHLRFDDSFFGGRATVSASVGGDWQRWDEQATSPAGASVPNLVVIFQASVEHNERPADDTGLTPVSTPSLIDGNFVQSTGISLGPDGQSYENLIFDFLALQTVDSFEVSVRDATGHPIQTAGILTFEVYTSVDRVRWTEATAAATTTFSSVKNAYVVTFPKLRSRYFKLVNFGTNSIPTLITEVQAFFHLQFPGNDELVTKIRTRNATASVTARPFDWLSLAYGLFYNDSSLLSVAGASTFSPEAVATTLQHVLQEEARVTKWMSVDASYTESTLSQEPFPVQKTNTFLGGFHFTANSNLTGLIEATRAKEIGVETAPGANPNVPSVTDGLHASIFARPYASIDCTIDANTYRTRVEDGSLSTRTEYVSGVSRMQLLSGFWVSLGGSFQRSETEGSAAPSIGPAVIDSSQVYVQFQYQPSNRLNFSARIGSADTGGTTTVIQDYHLDWDPFGSGAIRLSTVYDATIDQTNASQQFHRAIASVHWQLNPRAYVNAGYTYFLSITGAPGVNLRETQRVITLYFSLLL